MKRALVLALGTALSALSSVAVSAYAAPSASAYAAPRNGFGQPDLGEYWSNASLTPETRAPTAHNAVFSPEEVKKVEGHAAEEFSEGNKPTDPNAPPPTKGGDAPPPGTRAEFAAAGGAVGGYNIGWLDPGAMIMRVNGEPRTSIITTPDGKAPPFKAGVPPIDYRALYRDVYDNPENRPLGERCVMGFGRNAGPPMLSNGFYNNDYQFVQTRDAVAIQVEMIHDVRVVRLNANHISGDQRPWMGDSIGHWDGDTLVVETTNIPQGQAYHGSWKNLTVTERFTRTAPGRMLYQFVIHDPTMWDKDWGGEYEFHPMQGIVYEYACHEGNYALRNILAGARAKEAEAGKDGVAAAKTGGK